MIKYILTIGIASLLFGCIVFDKKSTAVTFHQFNIPTAPPYRTSPVILIPRVQIPSAVRRPSLVINDSTGRTIIDDSQRWVYSLDRAIGDVIGHHLTQITGLPYATQTPAENHIVLILDVTQFGINDDATVLQINYRIESPTGDTLSQGQGTWRSKRTQSAKEFVNQQSNNLSLAAADICQALLPVLPKISQ